jgi:hypothetical protein
MAHPILRRTLPKKKVNVPSVPDFPQHSSLYYFFTRSCPRFSSEIR